MFTPPVDPTATPADLAAQAYAELWPLIDRQLSPLGLRAMDELDLRPGEAVLDVGCGAGQTLLQLAERTGPAGRVVGVDIAPRLVEIARDRAAALPQVEVALADAQRLALPPAGLDAAFSRFGVMAFPDPAAAFAAFRRALKPTGRLAFCCWRGLAENELDRLPLAAAGLEADANPTPFSFADPDLVRKVLTTAGFTDIAIRPHDAQVSCGDLDATVSVLLKVGPLGRLVRETPALRPAVEPRLRAALTAHSAPNDVRLRAAVWIVTARAQPAALPFP